MAGDSLASIDFWNSRKMFRQKSLFAKSSFADEVAQALLERANSLRHSHPSVIIGRDVRLIESMMDIASAIRSHDRTRAESPCSGSSDDGQPDVSDHSDYPISLPPSEEGDEVAMRGQGDSPRLGKYQEVRKKILKNMRNIRNLSYIDDLGMEHKLKWSTLRKGVQPLNSKKVLSTLDKRFHTVFKKDSWKKLRDKMRGGMCARQQNIKGNDFNKTAESVPLRARSL